MKPRDPLIAGRQLSRDRQQAFGRLHAAELAPRPLIPD
jgi:hypothetical protein